MRVLVTGGCGYVGAHVVRRLRRDGHAVVVLDDLSTGDPAAAGDAQLVRGDVRDEPLVRDLVRDVEAIVHLAALKDATASLREPARTFAVNVEGSRAVLAAAVEHGTSAFVFSSSCAVYGTPTELPITEAALVRPSSPYGESKAVVERMLGWFEGAGGPRWMSLRFANAAGASPEGDLGERTAIASNLIPRVMAALLGEIDHLDVFGTDYPTRDGTAIRDYVHVEDLAEAHVLALRHLGDGGASACLNLGTGRGASVREVIALAEALAGRPVPVRERPRRPGDVPEVTVSAVRAAEVLGWHAARDLQEILATAWQWHEGRHG